MAIWQAAQVVSPAPAGRVSIPGTGVDWVTVLSPKFLQNDGSSFVTIGYGIKVIDNP